MGMVKINVLMIHHIESVLPDTLFFKAILTVTNADSPLNKAIVKATRPRLAHPSTVTGIAAFIKNRTKRSKGKIT